MSGDLPEGWQETELPTVAELNMGQSPPSNTYNNEGSGLPFFQGKTEFGKIYPSPVKYCSHPSKIAEAGDILISVRAPVGPTNLCRERSCIGRGLAAIRPIGDIPSRYLFYYLRNIEPWLSQQGTGSTFTAISKSDLEQLTIPLAPLGEQRRIVTKLEKLLAQVDACQERLAKIPVLLKRFRQSVLATACSGRLTADWREENSSVEPVDVLFTKIKNERQRRYENESRLAAAAGKRKPKHSDSNERSRNTVGNLPDIPETWAYFRLEELCHQVTDGTHKTPEYRTSGIPFLSVKNVRPFVVRDDDIKFISKEEHHLINARCNPEKGDILYTKIGATFGYAAANSLDYVFSIFVSLALLKPVTPFFSTGFAELAMNSDVVFGQARERVSGIGTPDLHLVEIRDFRIPLPPQKEQQEIVRRVEKLFTLADRLEARFTEGRKRVDSITQSILAKAFRGELVPTEFELAKAEGRSFESAEELLERIKANGKPTTDEKRRAVRRTKRSAEPL